MNESPKSLVISIKGLGNVPSFKNTKQIYRRKDSGQPFIATKKERKEWMERVIRLIESQLYSEYQTSARATLTGLSLRSWIASHVPLDDSRQWINDVSIYCVDASPGEEGAVIYFQKTNKTN